MRKIIKERRSTVNARFFKALLPRWSIVREVAIGLSGGARDFLIWADPSALKDAGAISLGLVSPPFSRN